MKVRAKRLKAGQDSELAKAKMLAHSTEGEATKLIMSGQDQDMEDVRNKRECEENNEEQGRTVKGDQQEQKAGEEEPSSVKPTDEEGVTAMNDEL
jgi:hypothetical protein